MSHTYWEERCQRNTDGSTTTATVCCTRIRRTRVKEIQTSSENRNPRQELASTVAGDGAAAAGLLLLKVVTHDPTVCQNQTYFGHKVHGRPTCPSDKTVFDLPVTTQSKTLPTSVAMPWSWDESSPSPPGRTFRPFLNGCLSDASCRQQSLES